MEKSQILAKEQEIILDEIIKNKYFTNNFYFTGGTALAEFYLTHRLSEDLDFFTEKDLNKRKITEFIRSLSEVYKFTYQLQGDEFVLFFILTFQSSGVLKVDFAKYPYRCLQKRNNYHSLKIDSLLDIAVNKLSMISERMEVKDYCDLYFILEKISLWDIIEGVRIKFNMEINPFLLAGDFTRVEKFTFLPKMIKPLNLPELKAYFLNLAKELGKKSIK